MVMTLTRREVLVAGTAVVVSVGLPMRIAGATGGKRPTPTVVGPEPHVPGIDRVAYFTMARFQASVGTRFHIQTSARRRIRAKLVSVTDLAPGSVNGECFSLLFRTRARRRLLDQGTFEVEHRELGRFALFLVPMERGRRRAFCEAVVNRLQA